MRQDTSPPVGPLDYYQACFAAHGDNAAGAGWPNERDRVARFDVVLDLVDQIVPDGPVRLCDIGCGSGELLRRIGQRGGGRIDYFGVDALAAPLAEARRKFPGTGFHHLDIAVAAPEEIACDIAVANGVFTVKAGLSDEAMWRSMTDAVARCWPVVRRGIVFNVMSKAVDWERDDLFHVSYDRVAAFLHGLAGRAIGFRADYGLYEYMAYAIKPPAR